MVVEGAPGNSCFDMYSSGERNSSNLKEMVGLDNSEGLMHLDSQIPQWFLNCILRGILLPLLSQSP